MPKQFKEDGGSVSSVSAMDVSSQNSQEAYFSFFEASEAEVSTALELMDNKSFLKTSGRTYKSL
jgi:hypothetical protein